jgi:hypothetical protein
MEELIRFSPKVLLISKSGPMPLKPAIPILVAKKQPNEPHSTGSRNQPVALIVLNSVAKSIFIQSRKRINHRNNASSW